MESWKVLRERAEISPKKAKRPGVAEAQLSTGASVSHQYVLSREILQIFKKSFYRPIFSKMARHEPRDQTAVAEGTNSHKPWLEHLARPLTPIVFKSIVAPSASISSS
jgi:hypothetical protein